MFNNFVILLFIWYLQYLNNIQIENNDIMAYNVVNIYNHRVVMREHIFHLFCYKTSCTLRLMNINVQYIYTCIYKHYLLLFLTLDDAEFESIIEPNSVSIVVLLFVPQSDLQQLSNQPNKYK